MNCGGGFPAGNGEERMRTFVNVSALDTTLSLWWEQPEDAPRNAVYVVLLDGRPVNPVANSSLS